MRLIRVFCSILFVFVTFALMPFRNVFANETSLSKNFETISSSPNTITLKIGSSIMDVYGEKKEVDEGRDTSPLILNDRTMIPIRTLIEKMGGRVHWFEKEDKLIIAIGDKNIILYIGRKTIYVNGVESKIDVAPIIYNERTIVPLRFLMEQLNFSVDWDEASKEIKLITTAVPNTKISGLVKHSLSYSNSPERNPLKGLFPFMGDFSESETIPYSMEYTSLPLSSAMTSYSTFDWTKLEERLNEISARGRHCVLRYYIDNPEESYGLPQFLINDGVGIRTEAKEFASDYNNPKLVTALDNFVKAFGAKYDGDPRIGFIQIGLIGFWGEWHTYPHDWMQIEENQHTLIDSFLKAFTKTKILIRNPDTYVQGKNIGYHDDSFAHSTLSSPYAQNGEEWMFFGRVLSANCVSTWEKSPIGGEVRPEVQSGIWKNEPPISTLSQDYNSSVDITHISWAMCNEIFSEPLPKEQRKKAIEGSRRMGYDLQVKSAYFNYRANVEKPFDVGVEIKNKGVAPFYYNWKVQLALKNSDTIVHLEDTSWDISQVIPTEDKIFSHSLTLSKVPKGRYSLIMKVINPLPKGIPLCFANETQDKASGWIKLGNISLK